MKRPTRSPGGEEDLSEEQAIAGAQNGRKKRRRCGVCAPCLTKINCESCSNCLNRRTGHQICKYRKCIELRKKTSEVTPVTSPADTENEPRESSEGESNNSTTKSSPLIKQTNVREQTGAKRQRSSSENQEQRRTTKNAKSASKHERKTTQGEKKATKREEEISKALEKKQEIQNAPPVKIPSSEATACHPTLQTKVSTESGNTAPPVPADTKTNPEHWCSCNVKDEGSVYKHLGTGSNIAHVRSILAKRFNLSPESVRIEKVGHSKKEGKNRQGCPIARWVLRRSNAEEKILSVVRQRPGHACEFSIIVICIVLWDGISTQQADSLYTEITGTLKEHAIPTVRKCGMNKSKQCACQGSDPMSAGASFSFGCSWNRFYNNCKFARSKTPRKFRLHDQEKEDSIDNLLQNLATQVAQTYKALAPEAFENQTRHDTEGVECRIGSDGDVSRPFSGITCCVDFCAHNHKDDHNMDNGATVVLTLLGKEAREDANCEVDEQLHSLPCYHLLDNNDNIVPPNYVIPKHILTSPMASSPLKEMPQGVDIEHPDSVDLFNGNRTFFTQQFTVGQNSCKLNPRVQNPECRYQNPGSSISDIEISKVPNFGIMNNVINGYHKQSEKELYPGDIVHRGLNSGIKNGVPKQPVNGYHDHVAFEKQQQPSNIASNNSVPSNGYNGDTLRQQYPKDLFSRVQNPGALNGRVNGYHEPALREVIPGNSIPEQDRIVNRTQSDACDFLGKFVNGKSYPGYTNRWGNGTPGYDGLPYHNNFAMNGFQSNGFVKNGCHENGGVRQISESHFDSMTSEKCDLDENSKNNHSTEDVTWVDDAMGGVGLALSHGSILVECAKQEVHATTRVKNPNRKSPTRLSLVFYQHRLMNFKNHGSEEFRKNQEQKKLDAEKLALSSVDGEFPELPFEAFGLQMLAETAVNYPSPGGQPMINRTAGNYPPGARQVDGTLDKYPSPGGPNLITGKDRISHGVKTNGECTAAIETELTPLPAQYPLPQTNGVDNACFGGSVLNNHQSSFPVSNYLRSLRRKENSEFPLPYPTYPYANTLPLTPFIPPIFLPPPRHPTRVFNPFTPAGRGSYHVLNSQHQALPSHEIKTASEMFNTSQNANDHSVDALLGRKRSHEPAGEMSSANISDNHSLKHPRLDQNDFSYLGSIFNKQPDIHNRVLGLPLRPEMNYHSKFAPYELPYPSKSIFTGTTTFSTDSLVNMAPFAGTLVGGGHYQW